MVESRDAIIRLAIALVFALFIVWFAIAQFGLTDLVGQRSDMTLDWLVVNAAVDGEDPYQPIGDLAIRYGVLLGDIGNGEVDDEARVHPRPPGTILLLLPLLLVPLGVLHDYSLIINTAASVLFIMSVAGAASIRAEWALLAAPLFILSHPAIAAFEYGSQSLVVATLITVAVILLYRHDSVLGGVALGFAIALKLWPGLLLLLLAKRGFWRGTITAVAMSVGLNLLAMISFGLSPRQVWNGLTHAGSAWLGFSGNGSLAGKLTLLGVPSSAAFAFSTVVLLAILFLVWDRRVDLDIALWGTVAVALLASPLSWNHYDVVLIPIATVLWSRSRGWVGTARWALLAWAVLTLSGRFLRLPVENGAAVVGAVTISGRAMIMVALVSVTRLMLRESEDVIHDGSASPIAEEAVT